MLEAKRREIASFFLEKIYLSGAKIVNLEIYYRALYVCM